MDIFSGETPDSLHLIRRRDEQLIQTFSYDFIFALNDDDRQDFILDLREKTMKEGLDLFCTCNPQIRIPMIIAKSERDKLHIKTTRFRKKDHVTGCNFEKTDSAKYHENWKEEKMEDGTHVHVRFENTNYAIPKKKKKEEQEEKQESPRKQRGVHTYNPITLRRFFVRWLLSRWNVKIRFSDGNYPDQKTLFLSMRATASQMTFQKLHSIR